MDRAGFKNYGHFYKPDTTHQQVRHKLTIKAVPPIVHTNPRDENLFFVHHFICLKL
jgi:hypothetical protein